MLSKRRAQSTARRSVKKRERLSRMEEEESRQALDFIVGST